MYQASDFKIDDRSFQVKSDSFPIIKIRDARLKRMTFKDNLLQIVFWVFVASGPVWIAWFSVSNVPDWFLVLCVCCTAFGYAIGNWYGAKYALELEFRHSDGTGVQWISAARSRAEGSEKIFLEQVQLIKQRLV